GMLATDLSTQFFRLAGAIPTTDCSLPDCAETSSAESTNRAAGAPDLITGSERIRPAQRMDRAGDRDRSAFSGLVPDLAAGQSRRVSADQHRRAWRARCDAGGVAGYVRRPAGAQSGRVADLAVGDDRGRIAQRTGVVAPQEFQARAGNILNGKRKVGRRDRSKVAGLVDGAWRCAHAGRG